MTGKIERQVGEHRATLRLIGHLHAAHLEALRAQLESHGPRTVLDLDQVTLGDVGVVRFLGDCEAAGIAVLHGPSDIREWIRWERDRPGYVVREDHRGGTPRTAAGGRGRTGPNTGQLERVSPRRSETRLLPWAPHRPSGDSVGVRAGDDAWHAPNLALPSADAGYG